MNNKTYWDALIERYENMSELEFESIVANLDKTPEIPFRIINDDFVYHCVEILRNATSKPEVSYNVNNESEYEYIEDMDLIAC